MRIQVVSDLHPGSWAAIYGPRYHRQKFLPSITTDADVLVIAGDSFSLAGDDLESVVNQLKEFTSIYKHVLYVPGNHEFYGTSIPEGLKNLNLLGKQVPGLHTLQAGKAVTIDNQRFLGDTGWQPWDEDAAVISDHHCINDFEFDAECRFQYFLTWLGGELRDDDIVVFHHAPSLNSLDARWAGDACNRWFITPEYEPLIIDRQPRLVVHGHTHSAFDYKLGKTRVVCNPRGYVNEGVDFNPQLIIDTDTLNQL